jgi:hypothetical protein
MFDAISVGVLESLLRRGVEYRVVPASSQVEARRQSSVSEDGGCLSHTGVVVSHNLHCGMNLRGNRQRCEPGRSGTGACLGCRC